MIKLILFGTSKHVYGNIKQRVNSEFIVQTEEKSDFS